VVLPSLEGSLFKISHYVTIKLELPLLNEDPVLNLPLILHDQKIDSESIIFAELMAQMQRAEFHD